MSQFGRKMTEAQAVVYEAEVLESETLGECEAWFDPGDDCGLPERFAESQARYLTLLKAAEAMVVECRRIQDPVPDDPYAPLATKVLGKARAVLQEIQQGELKPVVTFEPVKPSGG